MVFCVFRSNCSLANRKYLALCNVPFVFVVFNFAEHMSFWFGDSAGDRLVQTSKPWKCFQFRFSGIYSYGLQCPPIVKRFFFQQNRKKKLIIITLMFISLRFFFVNRQQLHGRCLHAWAYERTSANTHIDERIFTCCCFFFHFHKQQTYAEWNELCEFHLMRKMRSVVFIVLHLWVAQFIYTLAPFIRNRV